MTKQPTRDFILKQCRDELDDMYQWIEEGQINIANECKNKALTLIELLEVHDCGSVGGFDKGQKDIDRINLEARFKWLCDKYKSKIKTRLFDPEHNWAGQKAFRFYNEKI